MRLSGAGWSGPHAMPLPPRADAATPSGGAPALTTAPSLPPALSRQPAWTTVPSQPHWLAAGQAWTQETWAAIKRQLAGFLPSAGPAPQVAGFSDGRAYVQRVVDLTNRERSIRGLAPLSVKFGLQYAAEKRSTDMIVRNYFAHVDPNGRDPFWLLRQTGMRYQTAGENIALGQRSPEEVVRDWMNSPGHRANLLNPRFGHIGVSAVQNSATGQITWTQLFTD